MDADVPIAEGAVCCACVEEAWLFRSGVLWSDTMTL
jgi:hypothetical protein